MIGKGGGVKDTASWADLIVIAGTPLFLPVAADDPKAKEAIRTLCRDIGFDAVDAGPLANARLPEPMAYLNIQLGYVINKGMGAGIGFSLVRQAG